jgi:Tfp pilus assembly protein PilN
MIEINLVPDVKQELLRAQRVRSTVIGGAIVAGVIAIGVVVLLSVYIFVVQSVRMAVSDSTITSANKELTSVEDLSKILTIQNQLTKISSLNDEKSMTSRVFSLMSALIPPAPNNVQLSNLVIDTDTRKITLEGQAPNSYAAVEVFKKTIEGARIVFKADPEGEDEEVTLATNINTGGTSYGEDISGRTVLRFSLSFEYSEELFSSTIEDFRLRIATRGNVTDSHLGIPNSIFADRAVDSEGGQ